MNTRKPKTFTDFQEYAQLLLASRIFSEYLETKAILMATRNLESMNGRNSSDFPAEDVEPESYVEHWIKEYMVGGTEEWRAGVSNYFMKLLGNYPNAMNNKEDS